MEDNRTSVPLGIGLIILGIVTGVAVLAVILVSRGISTDEHLLINRKEKAAENVRPFSSAEDFQRYLTEGESLLNQFGGSGGGAVSVMPPSMAIEDSRAFGMGGDVSKQAESSRVVNRFSQTNVQVVGIDEPDRVKTDGKNVYIAQEGFYDTLYPLEDIVGGSAGVAIMPRYPQPRATTTTASLLPPEGMRKLSALDVSGDMLIFDKMLIVLDQRTNKVSGYDISDPANPTNKWTLEQAQGTQIVTARGTDEKLYLVQQTWLNANISCPFVPLMRGDEKITVGCTDIYHPVTPTQSDSMFTALSIDPQTGDVLKKVSFVGGQGSSVIMMGKNALYITYQKTPDILAFVTNFLEEHSDIVPRSAIDRLKKISAYDISAAAQLVEVERIMNSLTAGRTPDEAQRIQNELTNRMAQYTEKRLRELDRTGIVKIPLSNLRVEASGAVAGHPLNQFSLDEDGNTLRIATTIGGRWFGVGMFSASSERSESMVSVLGNDLNVIGAVDGLGRSERIYSVRFMGDRGYVVTFRETDPFYVIDLSDEKRPIVAGELKIPGYSSYLHPLGNDRILGIGKDGQNVKLSLFDVSNAHDPREVSKYVLDEHWSEALDNHHAFMHDAERNLFFLPGSKGGYIFFYDNGVNAALKDGNGLTLAKTMSDPGIQRALYVNNILYTVSPDHIRAYDERTFEKVGELNLTTTASQPNPFRDNIACTEEARGCPDGSFVSRVPPNCEFSPCPGKK